MFVPTLQLFHSGNDTQKTSPKLYMYECVYIYIYIYIFIHHYITCYNLYIYIYIYIIYHILFYDIPSFCTIHSTL